MWSPTGVGKGTGMKEKMELLGGTQTEKFAFTHTHSFTHSHTD